jgi:dTDP-4-dehydrorhamnose reductase
MMRLGNERKELNVVCDQIGSPTYAGDLAKIILKIIEQDVKVYGIYHYSNEGVASWYDFAIAIFEESNVTMKVWPINSEAFPTPAQRPFFSAMDKSKIKKVLHVEIPHWRESLKNCLLRMTP